MTYNVHSCIGMDGKLDAKRIARVIAGARPDVVALQELDGREIQVLNTHLGLSRRECIAQIEALLGQEWLGHRQCHDPVVFCGDLNALPSSPVCSRLKGRLSDAQEQAPEHRPRSTFSSRMPNLRMDHLFVSAGVEVCSVEVHEAELARVASQACAADSHAGAA